MSTQTETRTQGPLPRWLAGMQAEPWKIEAYHQACALFGDCEVRARPLPDDAWEIAIIAQEPLGFECMALLSMSLPGTADWTVSATDHPGGVGQLISFISDRLTGTSVTPFVMAPPCERGF